MMKDRTKKFFFFGMLIGVAALCSCETGSNIDDADKDYFVKYYGGNGNQSGVDLVANPDGTVVIVGKSEFNGVKRTYFVKVDAFGKILVERYLGGPNDEVKDIEPTGDGKFVILSSYNESADNLDIKIVRVTADGEKIAGDSVVFGSPFPYSEFPNSITVLKSNAGFVVAGKTEDVEEKANNPIDPDLGDLFLTKFDNNFGVVWSNVQGFTKSDASVKYFQRNDGEHFCIGYIKDDPAGNNPEENSVMFYYKVSDFNGQGDENIVLAGSVNNFNTTIISAIETSPVNPGYVAVGVTRNDSNTDELFICKLRESLTFDPDQNDAEIYTKILPVGSNQLSGISATSSIVSPQGYLVVGNDLQPSSSTENQKFNIWLSKLDLNGQVIWSTKFGSEKGNDTAASVTELPDGKILILGTVELGDNQKKVSLVKLNSAGQLLK